MLLLLADFLSTHFYKGFSVLHYLTLRTSFAVIFAFILSLLFTPKFISILQTKQFGQPIRNDGPESHFSKKGTPTMGGILILSSILINTFLFADLSNRFIWTLISTTILFGAIGLVDDYLKVIMKSSDGLSAKAKFFLQIVFAFALMLMLYLSRLDDTQTIFIVPFFSKISYNLGFFFVILGTITIVASSNAVNLTDGLDGLAVFPTIIVASALGLLCYLSGNINFANYLLIPYVADAGEILIFVASLIGAGLGFLWFNAFPAKLFMGDVGSLALGAILGVIAMIIRQEIVFIIMSGLFVMEALSVILQVASFKLTGKRIFKMAPLHHHYEKKGWHEQQVVVRFWIITIILTLVALATIKIR